MGYNLLFYTNCKFCDCTQISNWLHCPILTQYDQFTFESITILNFLITISKNIILYNISAFVGLCEFFINART